MTAPLDDPVAHRLCAAAFWRLLATRSGPHGTMWDLQRVHFEFEPDVDIVDRIASGAAGPEFATDHAFSSDGSFWGGRPADGNADGEDGTDSGALFIGVRLDEPAVPTLVSLAHGPGMHRPSQVLLQRSDDGTNWETATVAITPTDRRRHTVLYAPQQADTALAWRLTATSPAGMFAWDVRRLRFLRRGRDQIGDLSASGDAGEHWAIANATTGDDRLWGGRADDRGDFHVVFGSDDGVCIDRIILDQTDNHWAHAVRLERLDHRGEWEFVRDFDDLTPGTNDLLLHDSPPELLPGHGREGLGLVEPAPIRSQRKTFDRFEDRRILVLIAAYRDQELPNTVSNALAQAAYPEHVRFAICNQFDAETVDLLERWRDDPRFRVDAVPATESRGCCWARDRTFDLYDDEPYILQIDAHTRFAARWDVRYIEMLESIDVELPLLTSYPPSYRYQDGDVVYDMAAGVQRLIIAEVRDDRTTLQKTEVVPCTDVPGSSPSVAAGQIFTRGQFVRDVPYDPNVYFAGEEISLAARAFTHGYDLFYPNENLIWHRYDHDEPKHWDDHPEHRSAHEASLGRLKALFGSRSATLGRHGLGTERSLADFERHAGVRLRLHDDGNSAGHGPALDGVMSFEIDRSAIEPRDDWVAFVIVLLDDSGTEVERRSVHSPDVLELRRARVELRDLDPGSATGYVVVPTRRNGQIGQVTFRRLPAHDL